MTFHKLSFYLIESILLKQLLKFVIDLFIFYGYYHKSPSQTGWLKAIELYFHKSAAQKSEMKVCAEEHGRISTCLFPVLVTADIPCFEISLQYLPSSLHGLSAVSVSKFLPLPYKVTYQWI